MRTDNELADLFLTDVHKYHPKIGKYIALYAEHSDRFRFISSSGGMGSDISPIYWSMV